MASENASDILLRQDIIDNSTDAWSFFGWIALYDWVDGLREVIQFDGDEGSYTLMSARSEYLQFAANPLELPQTACHYFWNFMIYVCGLTTLFVLLVFIYSVQVKFDVDGFNLFQFNRVFGSVWVGRPLLLLRGLTAIIILSTSTATITSSNSITFFSDYRPTIVNQLILSGECLWIVYVMSDLLLPLTLQLKTICPSE
ncbi:hypothetical protein AC1031_017960 [Aphanomyces cochlioides]|nr:hypothetical protein AC1031_017960 [Aphanomyces cochlioides]